MLKAKQNIANYLNGWEGEISCRNLKGNEAVFFKRKSINPEKKEFEQCTSQSDY